MCVCVYMCVYICMFAQTYIHTQMTYESSKEKVLQRGGIDVRKSLHVYAAVKKKPVKMRRKKDKIEFYCHSHNN